MDAVIETDWSPAPFTMNWQLLRAGEDVRVLAGEPLCLFVPQRRGELASFVAELVDATDAADVHGPVTRWSEERARFLDDLQVEASDARLLGWQKDYFRGRSHGGRAPEHQTRVKLTPFKERPEE